MRYQKICSHIWHDEKFVNLSNDAKLLFIYTLSSPHSNAIGLYALPFKYIESDLGWDSKQLGKAFNELLAKELILYDESAKLICIVNHLKHNTLENENQTKSAIRIISSLPKSPLYSVILKQLNKPFHKLLRELLQEQYAKPITLTEAFTSTETYTDTPLPKSEAQSVLDYWNTKGIVVHKSIFHIKGMGSSLESSLQRRNLAEIMGAIDNYETVLHGDKYYFKHKWNLKDFLNRGLDKFVAEGDPLNNFLKNKQSKLTNRDFKGQEKGGDDDDLFIK